MIDANSQFFAILTNVGMAKQANATALGIAWTFAQMGVGDANETDPIPNATQTQLIHERRRRPLNQVRVDQNNSAVIIAEQIIPADEGGWWIREIGLYDADGDLVAVANCAPSFKPVLSQGSGRTQVVRMNFIVASTGNITLKIDPAVVLATRDYVDTRIIEELNKLDSKQSVRVATTANIVLAGLQTVDGVALAAGDRVLVKNQAVAKDNGIWLVAALAWKRAADADSDAEVTSALLMSVEQGATQADTRWQLTTDVAIVVGTTSLTFQNVTQGFAPINSPALINPTANTPAQFDRSQLLATTDFVQRALGGFSGSFLINTARTLTAAYAGASIELYGVSAFTVTLPLTSVMGPLGSALRFVNLASVSVTIATQNPDLFLLGPTSPSSIVLQPGDTLEIHSFNGWVVVGGSIGLKYAGVMSGPNWITQPQFAYDKSLATTEFAQRVAGNFSGFFPLNVSTVLTAAHVGGIVFPAAGGGLTFTLPAVAGIRPGSKVTLYGNNEGAVILPPAGGTIAHNGIVRASMTLGRNDSVEFTLSAATGWYCTGGSLSLVGASVFEAVLAANGLQKFPSGLIIMTGDTAPATAGDMVHTLPTAFPNTLRKVVVSQGYTAGTNSVGYACASPVNKGSFVWRGSTVGNASQFIAFGD